MRGDGLAQGEEPDRGFVLLAILAVERLEDCLRRFRRAEQFFQVRDDRLVERDIELGSAGSHARETSDRTLMCLAARDIKFCADPKSQFIAHSPGFAQSAMVCSRPPLFELIGGERFKRRIGNL